MVTVRFGDPSDPHAANAMAGGSAPGKTTRPAPDTSDQDFEFNVEGMTPEQARRWVDIQIPYPNRANEAGVAARAATFVKTAKERWEEGTVESREKWRAMQFMLRGGNTLASRFEDTDLHVAELYKAIETLVPRIEEGVLFQSDPYFKVRGRKELDVNVAEKIGAFIMAQLHDDRFDHRVQPAIRAMLEYSFCGFKIWWDIKTERRIKKNVVDKGVKNGKRHYRITREEVEEVVWNGPRIRMLDPLDCIVDLGSTEPPHDARWLGDQQWMSYEDIQSYGRMYGWANLDQIENTGERVPEAGYREFDKQSRSLERFNAFDRENRVRGAPKRVRLTELWGDWDPDGGSHAVPHKLLVANDTIALCVQENPNDKKGMPYAIGRAAREGWEFLNVGPLDHTLSISASIDNHRNLALKSHENHLAPPLLADETAGLPDSMFDVAPGSVWRVQAQSLNWMPSPSTLRDYGGMFDIERRDIEEISGAPRIYAGTESGGSGTATEVERKVEEGNKRIRSYVLSFSFMMQTLVRHMHALNQQWVTEDVTFRVMGKAAASLGEYTEVGPNDLKHDVDFEFLGPSMLKNMGLRATQIQSFLSAFYPYIQLMEQQNPGSFQLGSVVREGWDTMVGTMPADRLVWGDANAGDMLDQVNENTMLMSGQEVPLHPMDDDAEHLRMMEQSFESPLDQEKLTKKFGEKPAEMIAQHYLLHQQSKYRKQQQQKARQQQAEQAAMQQQMQEQGGDAGRGTTGNRRVDGAGGGFAPDQGGMMPPGQTPGPTRGGSIPAGDRRQPVGQGGNLA